MAEIACHPEHSALKAEMKDLAAFAPIELLQTVLAR